MSRFTRRDFLAVTSIAATSIGRGVVARDLEEGKGSSSDLVLWYDKPARLWADALPIGNGRLGAMVFGGGEDADPKKELLQLNEDTLWSGKPRDGNNRDAKS